MTNKRLSVAAAVWLFAAGTLAAANFWEEKPFTTWSDEEVAALLTDSPWAKQQRIVLGTLSETPAEPMPGPTIPGASLSGPRAATLVLAGGAQFDRLRRFKVTVTWATALPIKLARVRRANGRNPAVPPEARDFLLQDDPFYVVTIANLPPDFRELAQMAGAVRASTRLERKKGEPIAPEKVELFQDSRDQTVTVAFSFPKTDPIGLDAEDIELVTDLGGSPLETKFRLQDMVFNGQLAL